MSKPTLPQSPASRAVRLSALQAVKMSLSANAFVRGRADLFYSSLAEFTKVSIPDGPAIWISGDCHVENIGAVADLEGDTEIELNDFDEAVGGSPAHDVLRLSLSAAMEARAAGLSGLNNCTLVGAIVEGYEGVIAQRARNAALVVGATPDRFERLIRRALKRTHRKLRKHFELGRVDRKQVFPMGERYWPLSGRERKALSRLLLADDARALISSLMGGRPDQPIEIVDLAFRVAGTGSLGAFRAAAIARTPGLARKGKGNGAECLRVLDIKEALPGVAPRAAAWPTPRDNADRIIAGARILCPRFGERMIGASVLGKSLIVRELMPEEKKAKLAGLEEGELRSVGAFLGAIVARAHARQLTATQARAWLRSFRGRGRGRPVPTWLWETFVHLVGVHESAYLQHCETVAASHQEVIERTTQEEAPGRPTESPRAGFATK